MRFGSVCSRVDFSEAFWGGGSSHHKRRSPGSNGRPQEGTFCWFFFAEKNMFTIIFYKIADSHPKDYRNTFGCSEMEGQKRKSTNRRWRPADLWQISLRDSGGFAEQFSHDPRLIVISVEKLMQFIWHPCFYRRGWNCQDPQAKLRPQNRFVHWIHQRNHGKTEGNLSLCT